MSEATWFGFGVVYGAKSPLGGVDGCGCLGYDFEVPHSQP
jgi:hypothetical protein